MSDDERDEILLGKPEGVVKDKAGRRKTEKKRGQIGGGVNVGQHVG
jgi:hypothetical protein